MIAACAGAFVWRHWRPRDTSPLRLAEAYALIDAERIDEALAALDAIDTRGLAPQVLAQWLNLKANVMALTGRLEETFELLDDLGSLADADDAILQLCAVGNRGIALLHADRLDEAALLFDDTEARARALREVPLRDALLAETWWWRAELARRRGDEATRRGWLEQAARLPAHPFAVRARRLLGATRR